MKYKSTHFLLVLFLTLFSFQSFSQAESKPEVTFPHYVVKGVESEVVINFHTDSSGTFQLFFNGTPYELTIKDGVGEIPLDLKEKTILTLEINNLVYEKSLHPIPLWWSIFPPLMAILIALIFKEVISALVLGILFGAVVLNVYSDGVMGLLFGFMRTIDTYLLGAINDSGHVSIILFSMIIGAIVAIISKNGGMQGVVDKISPFAKSSRTAQLSTWVLGVAIFFDDYANTLVVGNTMRPVTDRMRVSREKLAYIVDSTAAPIAAIAFVTTWIGAELSYIESGIEKIEGLEEGVYATFINSLQYSFYPILTLIFIFMLIMMNKDFGPMLKAENRARETGEVSSVSTKTISDIETGESEDLSMSPNAKSRWYNAAIPIFIIVAGTIAGLLYTGWDSSIWHDGSISLSRKLSTIIGNADSYKSLLWSSLLALIASILMTVTQKLMNLEETMQATLNGFKTMLSAIVILVLAWGLAEITDDMHTADFLTQLLSNNVAPWILPAITFVVAALVAFSTGSSWGTMAILYPLMMPAAWSICQDAGLDYEASLSIFHNVVASVLAGSVLGDHCSPISDTTILSSLASSCHHIDHVKTQMPYALTVGGVAIFIGIIPSALGLSSWICLPLGIACLWLIIKLFGKDVKNLTLEDNF
jgi:Na+/H+ antiporter NhaC